MTKEKARRIFSAGFFCLFFAGCATVASSIDPRLGADQIASENGFDKILLKTQPFLLNSYVRIKKPGEPLHLYIEGDGLAWFSKTRLSDDPTPHHPLVLNLAAMDRSENVAYLGRPCQYTSDPYCRSDFWASKRFSEEVIASMNQAVDQLKEKAGAQKVHLTGYSGGGAVTVLLAARRADIASLRTIAGNLDHKAVNRNQHVDQLMGSLNPIDQAEKIAQIPQQHFSGGKDTLIPLFITQNFVDQEKDASCVRIISVPEASHETGWLEVWERYSREAPACRSS